MLSSLGRTTVRQCSRRAQSTLSEAQTSASSSRRQAAVQTLSDLRRRRTVFVRPWDGINSVPEAWAIIRGIERHFGRILDFALVRDIDRADVFQPYLRAEFRDDVQIPDDGTVVKVKVPIVSRSQQGGPGLADLRVYLEHQDKIIEDTQGWDMPSRITSAETEEEGFKTVDVKVEKTKFHIRYVKTQEYKGMGQKSTLEFGEAFAKWGGFASSEYSEPSSQQGSEPNELPNPRMAEAQERWDIVLRKTRKAAEQSEVISEELETEINAAESNHLADAQQEVDAATAQVEAETTQEVTATPSDSESTAQTPSGSTSSTPERKRSSTMTKRQRLLVQARELAQKPLPEKLTETPEQTSQRLEQERKARAEENASLAARVWKFFGGHS
ncbi:unnamed protein product [Somion occarium]|uniref:Uncharacterized protein n=1 Tax=Somion occarium TaxID=3059160 RepID=A0ABP1DW11_9APHY